MNWQQKLAALKALTPTHLEMREPGDWYISASSRDASRGSMLVGIYGNGKTPKEAVEDDWRQVASEPRIVINAMSDSRRCVRWSGCMWQEVKE